MSSVIKHTEERLMKVLLAPVISEKATFVAEKNDKGQSVAHKRIVSAGRDYDGQVEILDGLKEGDTIITVGFQDLEDGELIKI